MVFFIIDIILFLTVVITEVYKYNTNDSLLPQEWAFIWQLFYITYAVFLIVWFSYYMFLAQYFWKMLKVYSNLILQLSEKEKKLLRFLSTCMIVILFIGSLHSFVFNSILDILILYRLEKTSEVVFGSDPLQVIIEILEFFELMIPLLCGLYMIYII